MNESLFLSGSQVEGTPQNNPQPIGVRTRNDCVAYTVYSLALTISISTWFLAIRAPLWEDETGSFWQISDGFLKIWPRQFASLSFPAYSYILWLWIKLFGTSEAALRFLSVLAMLGAVYLLYLVARQLFEQDVAIIATIIFSLNPAVVFGSIDVRPYAFALLVTNAAILILLRLRKSKSDVLAGLFGLCAALILYFRHLSAVILPALLLCFVILKFRDRTVLLRQLAVMLVAFGLALIPLVPGLRYLFHTSNTHVCAPSPSMAELIWTLASGWWLFPALFLTFLVVAASPRSDQRAHFQGWHLMLCGSLALIPVLTLFGISAGTSTKVFAARHCLVGAPGISLCWAMAIGMFRPRSVRLVFCVAFVAISAGYCLISPTSRLHNGSWKYALEVAEKNASTDNAPVVICSGFVESDYTAMPIDSAKSSPLFAQLSYYKLSVPVVPLPLSFNDETVRVGSLFFEQAEKRHRRFLVVAHVSSSKTLEWIENTTSDTYSFRTLGIFDGFEVLEFVPRSDVTLQSY